MMLPDRSFPGARSGRDAYVDSHPIAHPIASTSDHPSAPVNPVSSQLGSANDGAHLGTTPPPRARRGSADVAAISGRLSERDWAVVQSVAEHQFLTGHQIAVLHFHQHANISGPRIARRVLARLRDMRVLGALGRRVGGVHAGSSGLIHYVDVVGDQLLRGRSGRTSRRPRDPSERFLAHRLAIADAHIELAQAHRTAVLEVVHSAVEPASWRRHVGPGGARVVLKPDLYAETSIDQDSVYAWFIEIDLSTESLPTLLRKCRAYEAYRRTGTEQDHSGSFPTVVWVVSHSDAHRAERRREALKEAIARDHGLPSKLFHVISPQQLIPTLQIGGQQ